MNVLGTVRFNRKNMPEKLKKLEKGDAIAMSQDHGCKVAGQKKPVTIQRTVDDNNTLVDTGKQGNLSRNQCLTLTVTKVWWGLIEWNSSLHHALSCAVIGRCVRSSSLFLT